MDVGDSGQPDSGEYARGGAAPLAYELARSGSAKAEAYLDEQTTLTRLQIEDLKREDKLRHWSLRIRHVSDVLKLAFELAVALIFIAIVAIIGGAIWSAAHDDSLVIDAFKVPPDMAQRGLTGDVVAASLLDRLTTLQSETDSSRAPSSYSSNWGGDIKVEIPNTGISISEAYRYLAGWLGHQTHISGEVYRTANGIVLVTRVSGHAGAHLEGKDADLDALVNRAAAYAFEATQPFRYGVYLLSHGQTASAAKVLSALALNGPASERPWAYALWMYAPLSSDDVATAVERAHTAAALDPQLILAQINAASVEAAAAHDEQVLRYANATRSAFRGPGRSKVVEYSGVVMDQIAAASIAEEMGDFESALRTYETIAAAPDFNGSHWSSRYMMSADAARQHDLSAARHVLGSGTDAELVRLTAVGEGWNLVNFDFPQFREAAEQGDWRVARADLEHALATPTGRSLGFRITARADAWPRLASAEAHLGDTKAAWALIGKTPLDCYSCLRARGEIDALGGNWNGADYWYARAVRLAPSVPFAYAEWGEMLLHKGDPDGAIAKFTIANQKGPHFADPLELWGEALIAKNRSDLALAKFEEAAKYAPNWGRLHLKWGEALWWSGDHVGAQKQFATAGHLDLTPSEKSQLAKVSGHG